MSLKKLLLELVDVGSWIAIIVLVILLQSCKTSNPVHALYNRELSISATGRWLVRIEHNGNVLSVLTGETGDTLLDLPDYGSVCVFLRPDSGSATIIASIEPDGPTAEVFGNSYMLELCDE